ncbi:hypothetical protein [Streptomyces benahoarensis]|uniref:hypothetical protein n=1 Tax=Streptomyces benahoarensis TaxID=2595054 RepID=UPI00163D7B67|nr:hypothetical protein [Streptomyces benahoarensis]
MVHALGNGQRSVRDRVHTLAVQAIDLGPRHRVAALRLSQKCVEYARNLQDPRAVRYQ